MILGYIEDGRVVIYKDEEHLRNEWGKYPTDVISEVVIFYDENGNWLKPIPTYKEIKFLPWFKPLSGFQLTKSNESEEGKVDPIGYLLQHETYELISNEYFSSLEQLRAKFPYNQ